MSALRGERFAIMFDLVFLDGGEYVLSTDREICRLTSVRTSGGERSVDCSVTYFWELSCGDSSPGRENSTVEQGILFFSSWPNRDNVPV